MLARVTCAVHPETPSIAACTGCRKALCETCAAFTVEGAPSCTACAEAAIARSEAFGGVLVLVVAAAYLVLLAVGLAAASRTRILGAGFAAVFAIGLGRVLQVTFKVPAHVMPRRAGSALVDATSSAR